MWVNISMYCTDLQKQTMAGILLNKLIDVLARHRHPFSLQLVWTQIKVQETFYLTRFTMLAGNKSSETFINLSSGPYVRYIIMYPQVLSLLWYLWFIILERNLLLAYIQIKIIKNPNILTHKNVRDFSPYVVLQNNFNNILVKLQHNKQ